MEKGRQKYQRPCRAYIQTHELQIGENFFGGIQPWSAMEKCWKADYIVNTLVLHYATKYSGCKTPRAILKLKIGAILLGILNTTNNSTHTFKKERKKMVLKKKTVRQAALCRTKFNENGDTFFRQQEFVAEQIKTHKKCPGPLSLLSARKC